MAGPSIVVIETNRCVTQLLHQKILNQHDALGFGGVFGVNF
jgi:hypothetical protein